MSHGQESWQLRFDWGLDGAAAVAAQALLRDCASGRELIDPGWDGDVAIVAETGASAVVPVLRGSAFEAAAADR